MAIILLAMLKISAITSLIEQRRLFPLVLLAPALGRWNVVLLSWWQPYARPSQAASRSVGPREAAWATIATVVLAALAGWWQGAICWAGAAACSRWIVTCPLN
jgi:cobalamin synthase